MEKKQDVVLETAVARNKKKNGFLYETFEKMGPANKDSAPWCEMAKLYQILTLIQMQDLNQTDTH